MPNCIAESEILAFLKAIEVGGVTLTPLREPQDVYAGNVPYAASNGWEVTIFNDANEWDYIDHIRTADGRECGFNDIDGIMTEVTNYEPSVEVSWRCYRIPGYCAFRCVRCGQRLTDGPPWPPSFLCPECQR